ncbi:MAG: desulfoferrodoxin [Candidatus Woesearchaeota archaeon]|jgi:superoxide reductase
MAEITEIYKCNVCGHVIEVLHGGECALVCCGKPMELLEEKTNDVGQEKHVPVVEIVGDHVKVKVGEIPHPMEPNHYIEWIEIVSKGKLYRIHLKPGDLPEAEFPALAEYARAYCNIHGLWIS